MTITKRTVKGSPLTWVEVDQNFDNLDTLKADKTALASEVSRATAAENLKAPIDSPAFTGTVTGISKAMVGLTNTEDKSSATIRGEITNLNVTTALGYTPENAISKGAANGYAPLDGTSKVPAAYLPSYVDDVLEFATVSALPAVGEAGKIYVITSGVDINKEYRWSGSTYILLVASPGTTDAIAEGTVNLFFTAARAIAATVGSYLSLAGGTLTGALTGTLFTARKIVKTPVALTSTSGSIAIDMSDCNFTHTMTENTTLANPTNLTPGQSGRIKFTNNATTPKTLSFGSYWLPVGGVVQTLTASTNAVDMLVYEVDSATTITFKLLKDRK